MLNDAEEYISISGVVTGMSKNTQYRALLFAHLTKYYY
jgi:hypothetical protein